MIRVLKRGKENIVTCNFCGSKLSYYCNDIRKEEVFVSQRESYFQKYIVCPECENKVKLYPDGEV